MADIHRTHEDAKGQLYDEIGKVHAGMLGVEGAGQHMQPMHPYLDRDTGEIWFITSRDTDLVAAVKPGGHAHFTVTGKKHDYWACMSGPIAQVEDDAKLDELWNAMAAAWFDKGRQDHEVTLLRLRLKSAAIWSSTRNPVVFAIEIARAQQTDKTPEIGEHVVVEWA